MTNPAQISSPIAPDVVGESRAPVQTPTHPEQQVVSQGQEIMAYLDGLSTEVAGPAMDEPRYIDAVMNKFFVNWPTALHYVDQWMATKEAAAETTTGSDRLDIVIP